jgi:hypothetical protein
LACEAGIIPAVLTNRPTRCDISPTGRSASIGA